MKNIPYISRAFFLLIISSFFVVVSCSEDDKDPDNNDDMILNLPETPFDYVTLNLPQHLTTSALNGPGQNAAIENDNTPDNNQITNHGATLGRVLFYDKSLSKNGTIACASCHNQSKGFSDDAVLSLGFEGGTTRRHSMSLINARWYSRGHFFWDERAATLEDQVLMPFQDPVEMGMNLNEVVDKVRTQPYYEDLFKNAFGSSEVNSDLISKALAQFVRSIVSYKSRYDIERANVNNPVDNFPGFTASENNGKRIFFLPRNLGGAGCLGCHATEAFINPEVGPTNNGLDLVSTDDLGVYETFPQQRFLGAFKVPSLKNIEYRAPYMHDGRFATLEEVVEHYNSGVQDHPNLAPPLRDPGPNGQPQRLNLTAQQKTDLVNFLKTLSDPTIATEEKWSNPFINN